LDRFVPHLRVRVSYASPIISLNFAPQFGKQLAILIWSIQELLFVFHRQSCGMQSILHNSKPAPK
jgi:hypothetical protein